MAIYNFRNKTTEDINYGHVTKNSLKLLPKTLHQKAQIKLARISAATSLEDLRELRGNRLETLQDINALLAMKLSRALGASPQFWLKLQNNWEISQIKESKYQNIHSIAA